jgi:Tfp pilus assembly protein PilO
MKMTSTNKLIVAMLGIAVLTAAFWILMLGPKRQEASDLGAQVEALKSSLAQHQQEIDVALAARESFSADYQQLVVLGKAVPGDDDTASLLVQLNRIADRAGVTFRDLELSAAEGADRGRRLDAAAGRGDRAGRPRGDAVHADLRRRVLRDRRLHQGARRAGQDNE